MVFLQFVETCQHMIGVMLTGKQNLTHSNKLLTHVNYF
jgi:hypothetical protein